jgi:carboxyl-terminal processing protease
MKPRTLSACFGLIVLSPAIAGFQSARADEPRPAASSGSQLPSGLAMRIEQLTDVVLEHHIDPPTRQQMILSGLKALYRAAGKPVPAGLSGRLSAVTTREQFEPMLIEAWRSTSAKPLAPKELEDQLVEGLLASVPGNVFLVSEKDRKVTEQSEGNRYVGIHVALQLNEQAKRPQIASVIEGGPADRAGVKAEDLVEQIDGVDTDRVKLRDAIDRLRGDEGTKVTIKVRQPKAKESRTYSLVRGRHARQSLRGVRKQSGGGWSFRVDGPDPIGYLKIKELSGSTPHELHRVAQQLEGEGIKALVLDLRALNGNSAHTTVLVADSLLESGAIGRICTTRGQTIYQAEPDAIFRGWKLAVLVDGSTSGTAEWLAAALQDNRRATLIGSSTHSTRTNPGFAVVNTVIPVAGEWSLSLPTGALLRGDGRPLSLFDQSRPALVRQTDKLQVGVHPDVAVADASPLRLKGVFRFPTESVDGDGEIKLAADTALSQAVETLRTTFKKT